MAEDNAPKFSIVKLIPLTVLVAIVSQISIFSYYYNFDFSPITYFEPSEIIVASAKDFILISALTLLYIQFSLVVVLPTLDRRISPGIQGQSFRNRRSRRFKFIKAMYIFGIANIVCGILIKWFNLNDKYIAPIALPSIFIGLFSFFLGNVSRYEILSRMRNFRSKTLKKYFPYLDPMILVLISLLFLFSIAITNGKYEYVRKYNPYKGSILITEENEPIRCTTKVIFIGKSQKFYFVYNTPDSSIRVIDREKLKKEVIKIRPDFNFLFRF